MTHTVSFPNIGIGPFTLDPVAFSLFGREIRWYGVIICIGMILGVLYSCTRLRRERVTLDDFLDFILIAIPAGIIGARAYFVLTKLDEYDSFLEMIAIWNGGIAIYGAIIGGVVALFFTSRFKKISFLKIVDICVPAVALGQAVGRWGNFMNAEAYGILGSWDFLGKIIDTPAFSDSYFLKMQITSGTFSFGVHPTFLYESLWDLLCFVILCIIYRNKKFDGQITFTYFAFYGFGRFFIEGLRADSLYVGHLRISQLIGCMTFIVFAVLLTVFSAKHARKASGSAYEKQFTDEDRDDISTDTGTDKDTETDANEETKTTETGETNGGID